MRWIALLLLVVGCTFSSPKGMADASGDSGTICEAWATRGGHVKDLCEMAPDGSWQISSATATYNTDTGTYSEGASPRSFLITQAGNRMLRVVSVDSFEVSQGASLRVVGQHPLLVLSWSTIVVAGTIDVSSQVGSLGAGGNRQDCDVGENGQGASEAGGGGGGGLNQVGKDGGAGNTGANAGGMFGSSMLRPVGFIAGGCRGGNGGGAGGPGGDGGGAIQLTARTSITIASTGRVHAGGLGGAGALGNGGGGGGGSGGYIGLDAPLVTTAADSVLAANGGGGGAGCQGGTGAPGQNGVILNVIATGGSAASCTNGANGGNGGARGAIPTVGADSVYSGGGGGGGAGFIVIWTPSSGFTRDGVQSPPEALVSDPEPPL
jgi:hypothetical protein